MLYQILKQFKGQIIILSQTSAEKQEKPRETKLLPAPVCNIYLIYPSILKLIYYNID